MTNRHMVVGLDGSPGSAHALRWALARTERFGPVTPVAAWQVPWWALVGSPTGGPMPPVDDDVYAEQVQVVAEQLLSHTDPSLRRPLVVVQAPPGPALVEAAADADLLVVGSRGHGAVAAAVLGSVSAHCANHAVGPVAIVPATASIDDPHRAIVVGVDGSTHSEAALRWAVTTAEPPAVVRAVHVWDIDAAVTSGVGADTEEQLREQSLTVVHRTVDRATAGLDHPGVTVESESVQGDPRVVLADLTVDRADLLVLGSRGHTGLAHLLLGSVTTALIHRPPVATVVVR